MLDTLGSNRSPGLSEASFGSAPNLNHYIDIVRRRFFYFLFPFGLISILGLLFAANLKPNYLSEGKILAGAQPIAPDIVKPVLTATAYQRINLLEQRVTTRDNLLSIAAKFKLFPQRSEVLDLMRESLQIKLVQIGQPSFQSNPAIAFTVGFQYEDPEIAMRVANEFVDLIVSEDSRSRTTRSTEAVKILTDEARDIEDKLESTQAQISELERQPEAPDQKKAQLAALAALKGELIQKTSVYSDAHPAVSGLKRRIAALEKTMAQAPQDATSVQSTRASDIEALNRRREALEKRLAEANVKLAAARLGGKIDQDEQYERLQVIEAPSLPQKAMKSNRLKIVAITFVAALALGLAGAIGSEFLDGSIRNRQQLSEVVASPLILSIPYIDTRSDVIRRAIRVGFGFFGTLVLLAVLGGLVAAIAMHLPIDLPWKAGGGVHAIGQ